MMEPRTREKPEAVKPHPTLPAYYDDPRQRSTFVRALFDRTARHYDRINRILSLGSGSWHRQQCLLRAGLQPGMEVLDLATGTGLLARQAVKLAGSPNAVVGLDISAGMLNEARRTLDIPLVQAGVEQLPFADGGFDFLCMGYALRHAADLNAVFREFYRVLRTPGTLVIIEIGRPSGRLLHRLLGIYLGRIIPWLSRWTSGGRESRTLMRYYWDTIEHCVPVQTILKTMRDAGFADVRCEEEFGIFRAYIGCKNR